MDRKEKKVTNGGSAIGEAIGANLEHAVQNTIDAFLEDYACHLLRKTGFNPITEKTSKQLYLYDDLGNRYNFDGVIADESFHPLVLLESKYIRYKKHNRDKGSWICNAHSAVRKRYSSIRASVAVLAGSWSRPSLAMLRSYDVNCFVIPFEKITEFLAKRGIDFTWDEEDDAKAMTAWTKYRQLSIEEQYNIGVEMAEVVKDALCACLEKTLDNNRVREMKKVVIEILTSLGETKRFVFNTKNDAIDFLEHIELDREFDDATFLSIYDCPEEDTDE